MTETRDREGFVRYAAVERQRCDGDDHHDGQAAGHRQTPGELFAVT